jgi:hypothetical protein
MEKVNGILIPKKIKIIRSIIYGFLLFQNRYGSFKHRSSYSDEKFADLITISLLQLYFNTTYF